MSDLTVGLLGAGHIAEAHLAAWRRAPGCRVAGLFDVVPELAGRRARQHGLPRVFTSLDEALEAVDIVDVCTPPQTHAEILDRIAAAGLHGLVEKPVVTDLASWERLRPSLEASRGRIAVVHNLKFARGMLRLERWLASGCLGTLLGLEHRFLTAPSADRMLAAPHWSHALPGGRWFETLPHALYVLHALAGPLAVDGVTARRGAHPPTGVSADEVMVSLAGPGGLAVLRYSANCPANRRTFVLEGSDAVATWDVLSGAARLSRRRDSRWRRALGPGLTEPLGDWVRAVPERVLATTDRLRGATPHAGLIAAFARHVRGEGPSPTPLAEVDYVVRGCDAIGREIERQVEAAHAAG